MPDNPCLPNLRVANAHAKATDLKGRSAFHHDLLDGDAVCRHQGVPKTGGRLAGWCEAKEGAMNLQTKRVRKLGLRTEALKPGAEDVRAMENRVRVMELLYEAQRRGEAPLGQRGTYTGLMESLR